MPRQNAPAYLSGASVVMKKSFINLTLGTTVVHYKETLTLWTPQPSYNPLPETRQGHYIFNYIFNLMSSAPTAIVTRAEAISAAVVIATI